MATVTEELQKYFVVLKVNTVIQRLEKDKVQYIHADKTEPVETSREGAKALINNGRVHYEGEEPAVFESEKEALEVIRKIYGTRSQAQQAGNQPPKK